MPEINNVLKKIFIFALGYVFVTFLVNGIFKLLPELIPIHSIIIGTVGLIILSYYGLKKL